MQMFKLRYVFVKSSTCGFLKSSNDLVNVLLIENLIEIFGQKGSRMQWEMSKWIEYIRRGIGEACVERGDES